MNEHTELARLTDVETAFERYGQLSLDDSMWLIARARSLTKQRDAARKEADHYREAFSGAVFNCETLVMQRDTAEGLLAAAVAERDLLKEALQRLQVKNDRQAATIGDVGDVARLNVELRRTLDLIGEQAHVARDLDAFVAFVHAVLGGME